MSGYYTRDDLERLDAEMERVAKITMENEVRAAEWRLEHRERIAAQEAYSRERDARRARQQAEWMAEFERADAERCERDERARKTRLANLEALTPEAMQRIRRSRVDWYGIIDDPLIAERQEQWERRRTALAMRDAGMTHAEIGRRLCVSGSRVRELVGKALREAGKPSPGEQYLNNSAIAVATAMALDRVRTLPQVWPVLKDEDSWIWMGIAA